MALPINSLYSLTWGDYGTSLVSAIQLLRCHGDLVDCTLAAGGRTFPAHKIVLCAASPFLLDILKNTPCKHPVVMLAGVNANDLEALLEFVYRGEVSVDHSQLPSLLQAAHCLNIQGLAPQTVSKDDYSIQLQQMIPQHHEQEQLIATIAAPQQTVHAQVVEDIEPIQSPVIPQKEVSEVINQLLPARKRKPRVKKLTHVATKVTRTDGMENVMSSPTTSTTVVSTNGNGENTITTAAIKTEIGTPSENVVTVAESTPSNTVSNPASTTPKSGGKQSRSRSQSEQPATCPICYAVIRQSRNLRRHLELRHFAKPGVKKERKHPGGTKKSTTSTSSSANTSTTSTVATNSGIPVQTVQTLHGIQTVQVKKEPDASGNSGVVAPVPVTLTVAQPHNQQQQQHHQTTAIIDSSGNITHSGNGQQQIVTQTENTDGTTSLSIAQVQTMPGHQLTLQNLNQVNISDFQHTVGN